MKGRILFSHLPTMSVIMIFMFPRKWFSESNHWSFRCIFVLIYNIGALKQLDSKALKFPWILLVGSGKIKSRLSVLRNFLLHYLFGFCVTTNYQNKMYLTQVSVSPFKEHKIWNGLFRWNQLTNPRKACSARHILVLKRWPKDGCSYRIISQWYGFFSQSESNPEQHGKFLRINLSGM